MPTRWVRIKYQYDLRVNPERRRSWSGCSHLRGGLIVGQSGDGEHQNEASRPSRQPSGGIMTQEGGAVTGDLELPPTPDRTVSRSQ